MKVNKTLTLDYELVEKLRQEDNCSALVNGLIDNFYANNDLNKMNKKQLEAFIANGEMLKRHVKELKELKND